MSRSETSATDGPGALQSGEPRDLPLTHWLLIVAGSRISPDLPQGGVVLGVYIA